MSIQLLKEMFQKMVLEKNADLIKKYYHKDFVLYANGLQQDFDYYLESHKQYYSTPIQYNIAYDDETFFEHANKVAGRVWITITMPGEQSKKIEVILIVEYKDNKIYRLWELTYPDWSKMSEFN